MSENGRFVFMFQARRFLRENFTNSAQLVAFAGAYGVELKRPAVDKWLTRDSVPGDELAVLLALLEIERGRPLSIVTYVKGLK